MFSILITNLSRAASQKSYERKGLKISRYNNKKKILMLFIYSFCYFMAEFQSTCASGFQPFPLTNSSRNVFKGISDSHRAVSAVVVEAE